MTGRGRVHVLAWTIAILPFAILLTVVVATVWAGVATL